VPSIRRLLQFASAAQTGLRRAGEVSAQYPANWQESMAVVLDALEDTRE
jgi:hypothetical protein